MASFLTISGQLSIMALYCLVGIVLRRTGLVTKEGCRAFSKLLLYVILPCVIVNSFLTARTREISLRLAGSAAASVLLLALSMALSRLFLRRSPIEEFASSFSNAGFMGLPLITMALGDEAVICIAPFVALLNILQWTYGQNLLLGKKRLSCKALLLNPLVLALAAGFALYALALTPPALLRRPIASLAACNAPIAMIILGYYLAELPLRQVFLEKSAWFVSLLRLVVIPLASVLCVAWLPVLGAEAKNGACDRGQRAGRDQCRGLCRAS